MTMSETKERYSFTKLSTFLTCPYGFYLKYVLNQKGIGNAFSSYGSFIHELLEQNAKGEVEVWDLPEMYEWGFDTAVPEKFPRNKYVSLRDSYYKRGLDFLKSFQGYSGFKILGVEQAFEYEVDDFIFNGVIDIILKDESGKLIIRDYKSKSSFKSKQEKTEYARQLYLYSMYVKNRFGRFPDELQFLMFKKKKPETIVFDEKTYNETIQWMKDTVKTIREAFAFPPKCSWFYANNLCDHREYCDMKGGFYEEK